MLRWKDRETLDERVNRVLALKAALYTNGNETKLVERAISAYEENQPQLPQTAVCSSCEETIPVEPCDFTVPNRNVTFREVPLAHCTRCNTQTGSLFLMGALEDLAQQLEPGTVMTLSEALSDGTAEWKAQALKTN